MQRYELYLYLPNKTLKNVIKTFMLAYYNLKMIFKYSNHEYFVFF